MGHGKYAIEAENPSKTCKARGSHLRTHFKKMREVGNAIKGMPLKKAQKYLEDVLEFKQAVAFRRFTGGCGRTAQAKALKAPGSQAGWPIKPTKYMLDLLRNLESNAEVKGLDVDQLVLSYVSVNKSKQMRRRTYRAHGRINAYMSSPCHIELMCTEDNEGVKKNNDADTKQLRLSRKKVAQMRLRGLPVGGGLE